jgi:hypothetical protein
MSENNESTTQNTDIAFQLRADVNLLNMQSSNPHAKTLIPGKPSKSGLIGVWYKDNLYLGTTDWKWKLMIVKKVRRHCGLKTNLKLHGFQLMNVSNRFRPKKGP